MPSYNPYNVGHNDNAHGGSSHQHISPQNVLGQLASPAALQEGTILIGTPPYSSLNSTMSLDRSASSKSLKLPMSATSAPNSRKLVPPEFGKNWGHPRQDKIAIDSTPSPSAHNRPSIFGTVDINQLPIPLVFGSRWNTRAEKREHGDAPAIDSAKQCATAVINGASRQHTQEPAAYPQACGPTRHREQSRRVSQCVSPRLMPRNRYPQLPSPFEGSRPIVTPLTIGPPPATGPRWGPLHQVQQPSLLAAMNIQRTMTMDFSRQNPSGYYPSVQTLSEGTRGNFSPWDYNSNLHQGELENQNKRCHQLPANGWKTSSQQVVVERNQILAGHPSGSYEEGYEPLQHPAQRGDATRKRKYDTSRPIPGVQNQIPLLDPATEIFPPSNPGLSPSSSSSSSTADSFSSSPTSSNTSHELEDNSLSSQFEGDLESEKEAESLGHVVAQVLFTNPLTLENANQDEDMLDGSSNTVGKEEEQGPERVPDSDPFWALTGIPKPSIPREFFMALKSMSEAEAVKQKDMMI